VIRINGYWIERRKRKMKMMGKEEELDIEVTE
jgi:hypothetical protein